MDNTLFAELMGSVAEADDILKGKRAPARELRVSAVQVREIRKATGLSQQKFARVIHVDVGTLRNWEQGRRDPTGPARALLHVIMKNPKETLRVLAEAG
ncbi:NadS family protein [Stenotrophomonas rhizophila]|uniref:NadS family protein n=1 Tax=Stenotrophomonas rhizophila TaxID=216778 RepID=UPI0011A5455E|nr:NadS family protein [Stenotrophomonas rhizophila]